MSLFFISKSSPDNPDLGNEVHKENCVKFPAHPMYLGSFDSCTSAANYAKDLGYGEFTCCNKCCHEASSTD